MKRPTLQVLGTILAIAILTAGAALLAGCTMVRENVTGVRVSTALPTDCVRACDQVFLSGLANETRKSLQNLENCKLLPTADQREACVRAELARYQAAVQVLYAARLECINGCHAQGAGTAG